jgi:hypothetical protein
VATFFPGVTLRTSSDGAHRGAGGARIVDNNSRTDAGDNEEAWLVHPVSGFRSALYLRYWVRQSFSGVGSIEIDYVHLNPDGGIRGSSGTGFQVPSGALQVGGYARTGLFRITPIDAGLVRGQWHLVELATTGIGTTDGGRLLFLDGQSAGGITGLDFTTFDADAISIGENYSSPVSTTGALDFDDVAVSSAPNATWLSLSVQALADARACVPVDVALSDVNGAPARAPYDVVTSIAGAGATPFLDDRCVNEAAGVTVPRGSSSAVGWVSVPAAGDYVLTALHRDFLSRPGAPLGVGFGRVDIGCACDAASGVPSLALLAFRGLFRSRRPRPR